MENNAELIKHWNKILAEEGLSVWAGCEEKRLWHSMDEFAETASNHPRTYVPRVRRSSRTSLYPLVFAALSEEDQRIFHLFTQMTSAEIAQHLGINHSTLRMRLLRLRRWIDQQVKSLSANY